MSQNRRIQKEHKPGIGAYFKEIINGQQFGALTSGEVYCQHKRKDEITFIA